MSLHRFVVEPGPVKDDYVEFVGEQARRIRRVLRLRPGEEVVAITGDGPGFRVRLKEVTPTRVSGWLIGREPDRESPLRITLFQGLLKADRFEYVVQKATEIGVYRIVPFFSSRCVVTSFDFEHRARRWVKIAREAVEQSGRWRSPEIARPIRLPEIARFIKEFSLAFVFWEKEGVVTLKEIAGRTPPKPESACIVVGPEGGLSEEEVRILEDSGGKRVSLGPRILRAESAAVVASAILMYEFGDMGERAEGLLQDFGM